MTPQVKTSAIFLIEPSSPTVSFEALTNCLDRPSVYLLASYSLKCRPLSCARILARAGFKGLAYTQLDESTLLIYGSSSPKYNLEQSIYSARQLLRYHEHD